MLRTLTVIAAATAVQGAAVELSDADFEHTTQASTGQTTGKWFVVFHHSDESKCIGACRAIKPAWQTFARVAQSPGQLREAGVNAALVDIDVNPALARRFAVTEPIMLVFAGRQYYRRPLRPQGEGDKSAFKSFDIDDLSAYALGQYEHGAAQAVPTPPSWIESELRKIQQLETTLDKISAAVGPHADPAATLLCGLAALLLACAGLGYVLVAAPAESGGPNGDSSPSASPSSRRRRKKAD